VSREQYIILSIGQKTSYVRQKFSGTRRNACSSNFSRAVSDLQFSRCARVCSCPLAEMRDFTLSLGAYHLSRLIGSIDQSANTSTAELRAASGQTIAVLQGLCSTEELTRSVCGLDNPADQGPVFRKPRNFSISFRVT